MTSQPEFAPVGRLVKSSQPLELEYYTQQDLIHSITETGKELEDSPVAIPVFREVKMDDIPLLNELYEPRGGNKLSVSFSEDNEGRRNAVIQLLWGSMLTQFRPSISDNTWDVYAQGYRTPNEKMRSTDLVAVLDSRLRKQGVFNAIADSANFDAMLIPHLLSESLYDESRKREKQLTYTTNDRIIQGLGKIAFRPGRPITTPPYLATVNTYLSVNESKGKTSHQLVTHATYDVSDTNKQKVQKEYGYITEAPKRGYVRSSGYVSMASKDGLSRQQVEQFAHLDQGRNEPIHALQVGLNALRVAHNLRKIR